MNKGILYHIKYEAYSVDLRSLALWRIVTGLAVLYDLIFYRFSYLEKYYFSNTFRPGTLVEYHFGEGMYLVDLIGQGGFIVFLGFTFFCAFLFTVAYKDKLIPTLLFICYSIVLINSIYITNGFHFMVLVSVFWSIFLPTGALWSFSSDNQASIHPLALYALYIQIALIYLTSALIKNGEIWMSGNAMELIVQDEYYATGLAFSLRDFPFILKLLNYMTLIWEFLIPVFILIPFKRNLKWVAAIMIFLLHLGITYLAQVGPFLIMGFAFAIALLPKEFWNRINMFDEFNISTTVDRFRGNKLRVSKSIVILLFIVIMIKGNMRAWHSNSYISPVLKTIPGDGLLFQKYWTPSFVLYGLSDQAWVFFGMHQESDLGIHIIIEEDHSGNFHYYGNEIGSNLSEFDRLVKNHSSTGFKIDLDYSDYIYMLNLQSYGDRFPEQATKAILMDYYDNLNMNKRNEIKNLYFMYLSKFPIKMNHSYKYDYSLHCLYEQNVSIINNTN